MPTEATPAVVASFEEFYRRHADTVVRALSLALGDPDLGREATDEAMTRAFERWGDIDVDRNPVGWVYRVGCNWARTRQRRERWSGRGSVRSDPVVAVPADPELGSALSRLSADHRAVVVCRYYLDWSVAETAEALAIRPGTVKSRLARALDNLQRGLGDAR